MKSSASDSSYSDNSNFFGQRKPSRFREGFFIWTLLNSVELTAGTKGFLCHPKLGIPLSVRKNLSYSWLLAVLTLILGLAVDSAGQSIKQKLDSVDIQPFGRMIRQCCNFGYDAPVFWMPVHMGYITSVQHLGNHVFYGDDQEGNGIIYSNHGGFIDLGHVRDNADLVAFFAWHISNSVGKDTIIETVREGGKRHIELLLKDAGLTDDDILLLAQRISHEMSVWHEIRTYFGVPTFWPIHEKQSAFSPEDNYSNLLGTFIGYRALKSNGDFLTNMNKEIDDLLERYDPVSTSEATRTAMDDVRGLWWRKVSLPSNRFLLAKYFDTYGTLEPWLIPNHSTFFDEPSDPIALTVPETTESGVMLTDLFEIDIKPVPSIPVRKILGRNRSTNISELDFPTYVKWIREREVLFEKRNDRLKKRSSPQPVIPSR